MRLRAAAAVPLTLGAALLVWYGGASRKAAPPRTDTSPAPSSPVPPAPPAPPILVGLSRPVYSPSSERAYACPALGGRGCVFTTRRERFDAAYAIIDVLKDPRNVAALPFKIDRSRQLLGVIISEQDKVKRAFPRFRRNRYDFEVGYNKRTAAVWRPFMCNEVSRASNQTIAEDLLAAGAPLSAGGDANAARRARLPRVAAFVSNCVEWRLDYLKRLAKWVRVDSFGACYNNNRTCAKVGARSCDKVERAKDYKFVFAFENTHESHYVTEKVYTALRAGAVPIYAGAPEIREHVPPGSVLYADDFADADALGKRLRELIANDAAYARLLEWDIRAFSTFETVRRCPWQCRACELVARRLQRRADRKRNSGLS